MESTHRGTGSREAAALACASVRECHPGDAANRSPLRLSNLAHERSHANGDEDAGQCDPQLGDVASRRRSSKPRRVFVVHAYEVRRTGRTPRGRMSATSTPASWPTAMPSTATSKGSSGRAQCSPSWPPRRPAERSADPSSRLLQRGRQRLPLQRLLLARRLLHVPKGSAQDWASERESHQNRTGIGAILRACMDATRANRRRAARRRDRAPNSTADPDRAGTARRGRARTSVEERRGCIA